MTDEQFAHLVDDLCFCTREPLPEPRLYHVMRRGLADITDDALHVAFNRAARECKTFPTVATLREFAGDSRLGESRPVRYASIEEILRSGMRSVAEDLDAVASRAELSRPTIVGTEEERDRLDSLLTSVRMRASRLRRAARKVGRRVRRVAESGQHIADPSEPRA